MGSSNMKKQEGVRFVSHEYTKEEVKYSLYHIKK